MSDMNIQNGSQQPGGYTFNSIPNQTFVVKPEPISELRRRVSDEFGFFGPAILIYALIYAICTFANPMGIFFGIYIASSIVLTCMAVKKLEIKPDGYCIFYMISIGLLGISTFCTADESLVIFNKLGIFLLTLTLLLSLYCKTGNWTLSKWAFSMIELLAASLGELDTPFKDYKYYRENRSKKGLGKGMYVLIGLIITFPVAIIVLALLASADMIFGDMIGNILKEIRIDNAFSVIVRFLFMFFISYAMLSYLTKQKIKEEAKDIRSLEPVIAITGASVLTFIYIVFCGIQIKYLFLGNLPEKYTYAQYAREGFFQLLAVSILNLIIVLAILGLFRENNVLKVILAGMSVCTFIMIASSAFRMIMYVTYYYMSTDRVVVLWTLLALTLVFAGVLISIFKPGFPLFRYGVIVVTVLYIALSFARPEYIVARINLANTAVTVNENGGYGKVDRQVGADDFYRTSVYYSDLEYLTDMSADAAPAIYEFYYAHPEYADIKVFSKYTNKVEDAYKEMNVRTFNISWYRAHGLAGK